MNLLSIIKKFSKKKSTKEEIENFTSDVEITDVTFTKKSVQSNNNNNPNRVSSLFRETFSNTDKKHHIKGESDILQSQLDEIIEYLYETTIHTTNVKFLSKNAILDVENSMRANKVYIALSKASLLSEMLKSHMISSESLMPYQDDFKFVLENCHLNDWLVIISDNYIADLLVETFTKPLDKIKSDFILASSESMNEHIDNLEMELSTKKQLIDNAMDYLDTGLNKPNKDFSNFKSDYNPSIIQVKTKELSYKKQMAEKESMITKAITQRFYNDIKSIYNDRTNTILNYPKLNSDIKFKNMYLFVIQDLVDVIETFKPISDSKITMLSESKIYNRLSLILSDISKGLEGFLFSDYFEEDDIIKYNHFLMLISYIEKEIITLKELNVAEYVWLQVFDSSFTKIINQSLAIGSNTSWSKNDWSIKDNIDVLFKTLEDKKLPIPKDYSLMFKDFNETNIKPLKYIYENVDILTFIHLLDETVESISHSYIELIREDLLNDDIISTQKRLKWFDKHLNSILDFNVDDGLLVNQYFNVNTAIYSDQSLVDFNIIDEVNFYSLFKLCMSLNSNIPVKNIKLLNEDVTLETHILKLIKVYREVNSCITGYNNYRKKIKLNLNLQLEKGDSIG